MKKLQQFLDKYVVALRKDSGPRIRRSRIRKKAFVKDAPESNGETSGKARLEKILE